MDTNSAAARSPTQSNHSIGCVASCIDLQVKPGDTIFGTNTQRSYRSPLREEAARRTRETVVAAAAEVFLEEGYTGATIEQIAARADVSRPTVFGVGNKPQLFALARQRAATGGQLTANDEGFQKILAIPDGHQLIKEFAAFTAAISQRLGRLQLVLEQAAETDPELAQLLESSQQELLECARAIVAATAATGSLRPDVPREAAADMLWLQIQPTNYRRLVGERGWSHQAFEHWHATTMNYCTAGTVRGLTTRCGLVRFPGWATAAPRLQAVCGQSLAFGAGLIADAQADGALRPGVRADDLARIFAVNAYLVRDRPAGDDGWRRTLQFTLDGLRAQPDSTSE